jgi:hypothetical protein
MRLLLRSSTALWRRGAPESVAPAVFRFPQRGEFPGEQPVWFLFWRYLTGTQGTSGNRFLLRQYSRDTQSTTLVLDQLLSCTLFFLHRKIKYRQSKNCSVGNPSTRGNPGLKWTRTDAILKKIDWQQILKIKINVQQDPKNFRSI